MIESDIPDKPEDIASQQAVYTLRKTGLEIRILEKTLEKLELDNQKTALDIVKLDLDISKLDVEVKDYRKESIRKWLTVIGAVLAAIFTGLTATLKAREVYYEHQTTVQEPLPERSAEGSKHHPSNAEKPKK